MADTEAVRRNARAWGGTSARFAPLAPPLRWIGAVCYGVAAVLLLVVATLVALREIAPEPGLAIGPAVFFGLGFLARAAARGLADGTLGLPSLAGFVFMGFGGAMAIGGAVVVYDDPVGFVLLAFGLFFAGVGYLARRAFAPPAGKKGLVVADFQATTRRLDGGRGIIGRSTIVHVDENASPAQLEAAKIAWLRERWAERPDWVEGRIVPEDQRRGKLLYVAIGLWCLFALSGLGAVLGWGEGFGWLMTGGGVAIVAVLSFLAVRRALRQRKFGESRFVLRETPAVLGDRLRGEIETGVVQSTVLTDGFSLALRCVHRWEETRRFGSVSNGDSDRRTVYRREVLWEEEWRGAGHASARSDNLSMPIDFALPEDQPATSLDSFSQGIAWELTITAAMPGVDYGATFQIPVLDEDSARRLRP